MRFQQLKHNPNNIIRKKLVKSGKNWITVSTLAIAGGLFLVGSPSTTVKADTVNNAVTTPTPDTTDNPVAIDSQTNQKQDVTPVSGQVSEPAAQPDPNATPSNGAGSAQQPAAAVNSTQSSDNEDDTTSEATNTIQTQIPAATPTQNTTKFNIPDDAWTKNDGTADDTSGPWIGAPWYITQSGEMHIGEGNLTSDATSWAGNTGGSDSESYAKKIKKISFDGPVTTTDQFTDMFQNLTSLTEIDNIDNLDVSATTNLANAFSGDSALTSLDLSFWDTSNVTDMSYMFLGDTALGKIIFNDSPSSTKKVTDMSYMFAMSSDPNATEGISSKLKNLDITDWDTSNLQSVQGMFANNAGLTALSVPNWKTKQLEDSSGMFKNDTALKSVDLSAWTIPGLSYVSSMFQNDTALESVNLSGWATPSPGLTSITAMFQDDVNLTDVDISNFNVSNITDFTYLFLNDKKLKGLDLSKWDMNTDADVGTTKPGENTYGMFDGTDMNYIILGPNNHFTTNITLPSNKSDTWYNTDKTATPKSFSATDAASSIGSIYNKGADSPKTAFTFIPNFDITTDVTIHSNLGDKVVSNVKATVGKDKTVTVTVPKVDGYTVSPTTVTATVNDTGTITTDETVTYTPDKKPSGGNHGSGSNNNNSNNNNNNNNNQPNVTTEHKVQTVSTYNDLSDTPLYTQNTDKTMSLVTDQALAKNSGWYSDQKVTIDGVDYYRVATDRYVKADQSYVYQATNSDIKTHTDSPKRLYTAKGVLVMDRELSANSEWFTDRIIDIDGVQYYRVSTNEFIKADDVSIY